MQLADEQKSLNQTGRKWIGVLAVSHSHVHTLKKKKEFRCKEEDSSQFNTHFQPCSPHICGQFHSCLNQGCWAWNTTTTHPPRSAQSIPQPCATQAASHRLGGETPSNSASISNRIRPSGACDGLAAPTHPPPGASAARRCAAQTAVRCEGSADTHTHTH